MPIPDIRIDKPKEIVRKKVREEERKKEKRFNISLSTHILRDFSTTKVLPSSNECGHDDDYALSVSHASIGNNRTGTS